MSERASNTRRSGYRHSERRPGGAPLFPASLEGYAARTLRLVERTASPAARSSRRPDAIPASIPALPHSKPPLLPESTGTGAGLEVFPADWIAWPTCCPEPPGTYAPRLYAYPFPPSVSVMKGTDAWA